MTMFKQNQKISPDKTDPIYTLTPRKLKEQDRNLNGPLLWVLFRLLVLVDFLSEVSEYSSPVLSVLSSLSLI